MIQSVSIVLISWLARCRMYAYTSCISEKGILGYSSLSSFVFARADG